MNTSASLNFDDPSIPQKETVKSQWTQQPKCYGRVKNLEERVPEQWWKTVFADDLYLKTDGDVVEDPEITQHEIDLLLQDRDIAAMLSGKRTDTIKVLDLCCGQGRHVIELASRFPNMTIHGHDQSSYLIGLAKKRAADRGFRDRTVFSVGDCRHIPYPSGFFDLVIVMGNSFGYFANDDGDRIVLAEIHRSLIDGGKVILDLTDGEYMKTNFSERSWEWIDSSTFACRERQLSRDGLRLVSREVITDTSKGVIRDQFYQERLYTREELVLLMSSLGFTPAELEDGDIKEITAAKELSKRNEDLGMMEQRMFFKATKKNQSPLFHDSKRIPLIDSLVRTPNGIISPAFPFSDLFVLMGDPSRPCFGKLNNTWNPEDFHTRQKLFDALRDIGFPKSRVHIVSNHDNLVNQLISTKVPFVFNLCDEGFDNDALQELHIPALLEVLKIPYTGAGPNCLAFCYDKGLVNRSAEVIGVHIPRETYYLADIDTPLATDLERVHDAIESYVKYPAFVKPLKGDNSLGITNRSIVRNKDELDSYLCELRRIGIRSVIVQEYLQGTEYGVGMIGNTESGFHFLPILEVDYSKVIDQDLPPILGYESKWVPNSPYWTDISYKKANLASHVEQYLRQACVTLWERFGCRDYARFDFRCDTGKGDGFDGKGGLIKLLEVNPNPGWCWDGKLTYMAKLEGIEYKDLIEMILEASVQRIFRKSPGMAVNGNGKPLTNGHHCVPSDQTPEKENGTYVAISAEPM